ncbi:EpsD family peptidyl-prolyl cis-trans isomerase [Massilia niastensis]|uniref:EpsD family peptidyl-prolyl cis-trans isomerase n=1 Tax=Massilia niastensis TaxID=544911 RepID=UPI000371735C|nr:EpsD family peptidyl-prolyl cis-trans isomerase [Massilia niastensis]
MKTFHLAAEQSSSPSTPKRALCAALVLAAVALAGCGDKPKDAKPGQALASVNGEEITVLQLNEEMQRAGVPAAQQQVASKQLLQALIDRQLLENEAAKEKIDRDPKVMQAIERARSLIIAQAYMQKRIGEVARPTPAEVEDYFNKNPQFFANRKQFSMNQLVIPASALTPDLRKAVDSAKSLEEVAVMLDARKIQYGRAQVTRSTADLNPQLSSKLLSMPKGQLFAVQEGARAMLISIADVRDAPVTLAIAAPQISQYLSNRKNKELAQAEIQRLRSTAKIDYLNKDMAPSGNTPAGTQTPTAVAEAPGAAGMPAAAAPGTGSVAPAEAPANGNTDEAAVSRGVAGLK